MRSEKSDRFGRHPTEIGNSALFPKALNKGYLLVMDVSSSHRRIRLDPMVESSKGHEAKGNARGGRNRSHTRLL